MLIEQRQAQGQHVVFELDALDVVSRQSGMAGPALALPTYILAFVLADGAGFGRSLRVGILGSASSSLTRIFMARREVIAIDGKTARRSGSPSQGKSPLHTRRADVSKQPFAYIM